MRFDSFFVIVTKTQQIKHQPLSFIHYTDRNRFMPKRACDNTKLIPLKMKANKKYCSTINVQFLNVKFFHKNKQFFFFLLEILRFSQFTFDTANTMKKSKKKKSSDTKLNMLKICKKENKKRQFNNKQKNC